MERKAAPNAISDEEWALVPPYLTPMTGEVPRRLPGLREYLTPTVVSLRCTSHFERRAL